MDSDLVLAHVAVLYDVQPGDLCGRRRTVRISTARHVAAWALRRIHGRTLAEIGAILHRDHSTIRYAVERVEQDRELDACMADACRELARTRAAYIDRHDARVRAFVQEAGL